jgi:nitrogen fixation-related uncharacterized protein
MSSILSIIIPLLSLAGGVFAGKVFFSKANKNFEDEAKRKADDILKNAEVSAENLKKDRMLEAKENFLRLRGEFEEETQAPARSNYSISSKPEAKKTKADKFDDLFGDDDDDIPF